MKYFRFFIFFLFILLSYISLVPAQDSTGTMSGRVILPQIEKKKRTFRGRTYRNRLNSRKNTKKENTALKSPYIDVIIVLNPLSFSVEAEPLDGVKIVQKNAEFLPRVVPVTRNTEIDFINFDKFYHNVFSVTPGARFNLGRRPTKSVVRHKIERPGEIKLFCDIHAQMNATILSLDTPYFTRVQPNGYYKLKGLPPGNYLVQVYHPDLPDLEEYITIEEGSNTQRTFSISR